MITIFCTPKNFEGIFDVIQTNAIYSWRALGEDIEILIIGDSKGAEEIARNVNAVYFPNVKKSSKGVPFISDLFRIANKISKNNILIFINADILLPNNFLKTIIAIKENNKRFLIIGHRWDLDVKNIINFNVAQKDKTYWPSMVKEAKKHASSGIDYFVFKKNTFKKLPHFTIGRFGYDNWLIWYSRRRFIPVIDISNQVKVIHQNHHYNFIYDNLNPKENHEEDITKNKILTEGNGLTINDANYEIKNYKIVKKKSDEFKNRDLGTLEKIYPELYYLFNWYKRIKRRFLKKK